MPSPEPYFLFTRVFNELGVRYMVTGSLASIYYGEPRMTNDVDIVVFMKAEDAPRVAKAFAEEEFYFPPLDVVLIETAREQRGHFNIIHHHTGFKADIYTMGNDPLHVWGLARTHRANVDGETVHFAPPEYVIVRKLQFFREGGSPKHLRDIAHMLHSLGPEWDRAELMALIERYGLHQEWTKAAAS
jgi:hypothetical protein